MVGSLLAIISEAAPVATNEVVNRVEGEYIAGGSYRVRYVADAGGFRAHVEYIGIDNSDVVPKKQIATPIGSKPIGAIVGKADASSVIDIPRDVVAANDAVSTTTAAAAVASAAADDDDDYYDDDDDDGAQEVFVPPVVMSSRPSKPQDEDGIGCAIRNSLCGK